MVRWPTQNSFWLMSKIKAIPIAVTWIVLFNANFVMAQNITPQPTAIGPTNATSYGMTPTPLRFNVNVQRIVDLRLEAVSNSRFVFSQTTGTATNKRLYTWDAIKSQLLDTGEDGTPGSVIMPDDGRYMIFLFDELKSNRDINGDKIQNVVIRMFHFSTGQRLNLGVPARSATPKLGEDQSQFEYRLMNNRLIFSNSDLITNNVLERNAPWHIINMLDIVYKIEGTPTPTPTMVLGTPTPTFTPMPVPTPTPIPTVPPQLRSYADINADGKVDQLDLLLFQYFWHQ